MDTIIYFYKKHGITKPIIDSQQMKDYLLVKVGLNVGENQWFTHSIAPSLAVTTLQTLSRGQGVREADGEPPRHFSLTLLLQRLKEHREKRDRARASRKLRRFFEEEHTLVCQELEYFLSELNPLVDQRYECHCVYGDALRKGLVLPDNYGREDFNAPSPGTDHGQEDVIPSYWLAKLWQQYWRIPEFDDYLKPRWVEPLLENAVLHHFVVLGSADCIPDVIHHCARRMKSLRWILQERYCTEELQAFVEDFYEDYGLAVTLQPLEGGKAFTRLILVSKDPICVLDFTGEPHISPGGVAKGSIWIDFLSVEEKARRILERGEGISYFSVKEIWKRACKP